MREGPIERTIAEYENRREDGTLTKYLSKRAWKRASALSDRQASARPPSLGELVERVAQAMRDCPVTEAGGGSTTRFHSFVGGGQGSSPSCYVNPFVLGSAYHLYLKPWFEAFPSQLLVRAFELLVRSPQAMLAELVAFLGLPAHAFDTGLVYNTRVNRGVHSTAGYSKVGGVAIGIATADAHNATRTPWASQLAQRERCTLEAFFAPHNAALRELLRSNAQPAVPWASEGEAGTMGCT